MGCVLLIEVGSRATKKTQRERKVSSQEKLGAESPEKYQRPLDGHGGHGNVHVSSWGRGDTQRRVIWGAAGTQTQGPLSMEHEFSPQPRDLLPWCAVKPGSHHTERRG